MTDGARIHDLGFRTYDGERRGPSSAIWALAVHAVQRVLGLKRQARHKVFPVIVIVIAFIPAIVLVGISAFIPADSLEDDFLPSYGEYFSFTSMALVLFSAFVAPEALCTDRRTGMLSLYLASPLTRTTYVLAKLAAVCGVLLAITMGPQMLMLVANTIEGSGPDDPVEFVTLLARIVSTGAITAALYGTIALVVSSFTPRRGIASAGVVLTLLVSGAVTDALVGAADAPDELGLFNLVSVAFQVSWRIHGDPLDGDGALWAVSSPVIIGAAFGWIVLFTAVTLWRYQRLEVQR